MPGLEIPYHAPEVVFSAFAHETGALFLDSNAASHSLSRYSFICFSPRDIFTSVDALPSFPNPRPAGPLPFTGGLAGFFSYDTPETRLGWYDRVIGFDLYARRAWFFSPSAASEWPEIESRIAAVVLRDLPLPVLSWSPVRSRTDYLADISRVIEYIRAGDIFQANLAQRFIAQVKDGFDPWVHYLRLRRVNPAPFSAYLNFGDMIISSTSPERFLRVQDRDVETRPIKGTHHDAAYLMASAKDRAENIMIVDLLRNDLSKVCADDSVAVLELCALESYAGLHHLVSTVTGQLRPGQTALDALIACFPGGSITGAPKRRAMEIIAELEPFRRGPYCGAIGYLDEGGGMDTSIAIRTLVYEKGNAIYHAGGGITADSDPESEYAETLLKAQKVFESFSGPKNSEGEFS